MWLYMRSEQGISFVTPDRTVYRDRLAVPSRATALSTMFASFSLEPANPAGPSLQVDPFDERCFALVEDQCRVYFRAMDAEHGGLRLELLDRCRMRFGRMQMADLDVEREVPAVTMTMIRSVPATDIGPLATTADPARPRATVSEPRVNRLVYALVALLPTEPLQLAFVQICGPEIVVTMTGEIADDGAPPDLFPDVRFFDQVADASAAVMTTFLETGAFIRE